MTLRPRSVLLAFACVSAALPALAGEPAPAFRSSHAAPAAPAPVSGYTFGLLHAFNGADGTCPLGRLIRGADAAWYAVASEGGAAGAGTVWRLGDDGSLSTLHTFDPAVDGSAPNGLVLATDGNFYGVAKGSGHPAIAGIVYKLTPQGVFSVLHTFRPTEIPNEIIQGKDGALYGTTPWTGLVYRLTLDGRYKVLLTIDENAASAPVELVGALAEGAPGTFYGQSVLGGSTFHGTVYQVARGGVLTVLHSFLGDPDGQWPTAGPTVAPDGSLVGTTSDGGTLAGVLWAITTEGRYGYLIPWPADDSRGAFPGAPLTFDRYVTAFGTTLNARVDGDYSAAGTLYQVRHQVLTVLHTFAPDGSEGTGQDAPLTIGDDGAIYGMSCRDGPLGGGTVYRLQPQ